MSESDLIWLKRAYWDLENGAKFYQKTLKTSLNLQEKTLKTLKIRENQSVYTLDFLMRGPWNSVRILGKTGPYLVPISEKSGPFLVPFRDFFLVGPDLATLISPKRSQLLLRGPMLDLRTEKDEIRQKN